MMAGMGEGDTISRYPKLVDVFVAAGSDPIAGEASQSELSVMIRGLAGFRPEYQFNAEDLQRVTHPLLLIWGDHDPIGDVETAQRTENTFPNAQLHVLPTGHAPWWGQPEQTTVLIKDFLRTV